MASGSLKDRFLRRLRLTIDVLNVIFGIAVVALAVYIFIEPNERRGLFPAVFYLGAFVNGITGIKHFVSDRVAYGIAVWIFAALLIVTALFTGRVAGGFVR